MNIEQLTRFCKSLPSVKEDIKWENHLCFTIGEKMFFVLSLDQNPTTASFKVKDEDFDMICQQAGLRSAPYLGRYKWVQIDDIKRLSISEWEKHIQQSFELISLKFSNKKKKELGIG